MMVVLFMTNSLHGHVVFDTDFSQIGFNREFFPPRDITIKEQEEVTYYMQRFEQWRGMEEIPVKVSMNEYLAPYLRL